MLVLGSRLSDFTTASKTQFQHDRVRFVSVNVSAADAAKHGALPLVGDARAALADLSAALAGHRVAPDYDQAIAEARAEWAEARELILHPARRAGSLLHQAEVIRILNDACGPRSVIVHAAGGLPGDLHKLWRSRGDGDYHSEYGYSCMGYEIAGALGVKMARPDREVYAVLGDGSYLMLNHEIVTSLQEGRKITVVLLDNHGYQCIHNLQRSCGSGGFGNEFRQRDPGTGRLTGENVTVDFVANATSLGARAFAAGTEEELVRALDQARQETAHLPRVRPGRADHALARILVVGRAGGGGVGIGRRAGRAPRLPEGPAVPEVLLLMSRMKATIAAGVEFWNDSCAPAELADAVEHGAAGATSNPVIVYTAIKADPKTWTPVLDGLIAARPQALEDEIAWALIEALGVKAAAILAPVHKATRGGKGFLSMQVNPKLYPDSERMVEHGRILAAVAPNVAIKVPATAAGIQAAEELVAAGINVNATVSFTVSQAIAVAEAFERGLDRARARGADMLALHPYATLMVGRLDDHLQRVMTKEGIVVDPALDQPGRDRGLQARARGLPRARAIARRSSPPPTATISTGRS